MINNPQEIEGKTWNRLVATFPNPHVLQTWEWGEVKSRFGWRPIPKTWRDKNGRVVAAALILQRSLPVRGLEARMNIMYIPKGPLLDWADEKLRWLVLGDLVQLARDQNAVFIKIDPDVILGRGIPGRPGAQENTLGQSVVADLKRAGWLFSDEQIQFRNTVMIDLTRDAEKLMSNMKQKTRYNVRLAARKGVNVRPGGMTDFSTLFQLYEETAVRDDFVLRQSEYYQDLWTTFMGAGMCEPLIAEVEGKPVAGVIIFRAAGRSWFLFGMSSGAYREKMPNYLLQWEAMRRSKEAGCKVYDMWGAPDVFFENDPMWGVFRFKDGFGGEVVRHIGAWDMPVRPTLYRIYTRVLPRILDVMRRRGKARASSLTG